MVPVRWWAGEDRTLWGPWSCLGIEGRVGETVKAEIASQL